MLAMNLCGYTIIGYRATNIYKNIYKNKMAEVSLASVGQNQMVNYKIKTYG